MWVAQGRPEHMATIPDLSAFVRICFRRLPRFPAFSHTLCSSLFLCPCLLCVFNQDPSLSQFVSQTFGNAVLAKGPRLVRSEEQSKGGRPGPAPAQSRIRTRAGPPVQPQLSPALALSLPGISYACASRLLRRNVDKRVWEGFKFTLPYFPIFLLC